MKNKLDSNTGEYITRPVRERNNAKYTIKTVKFGSGLAGVWTFIKNGSKIHLINAGGSLNR